MIILLLVTVWRKSWRTHFNELKISSKTFSELVHQHHPDLHSVRLHILLLLHPGFCPDCVSMVSCIFYLYLYLLSIVFFNSRSTAPPPATSGPGPMSFIGASIHTLNVFCPYPWGTFIPEPHTQPLSLFVFEMSITSCIREFPGGLPCPTPASPPTSISWPRAPASPQPDSWHRFPDLLIHKNVRPPANMLSFCVWIFAFQRRSRRGLPTSGRGLAIQGTSPSLFHLKLLAFFIFSLQNFIVDQFLQMFKFSLWIFCLQI